MSVDRVEAFDLRVGDCSAVFEPQLDYAKNKQGIRYAYYVCSGRATGRKQFTRKAVPVGVAEQPVEDCYQEISISEAAYTTLAEQVDAAFDERLTSRSQALAQLTADAKAASCSQRTSPTPSTSTR